MILKKRKKIAAELGFMNKMMIFCKNKTLFGKTMEVG